MRIRILQLLLFKKITNRRLFHSAQPILIILFETFRGKGSRSKSVVNSVNLFRNSIASSTSFRNGVIWVRQELHPGQLVTIFKGFNRLWKVFVNNFINRQWSRFVGRYLYQNQRAHAHLGFQELSLV